MPTTRFLSQFYVAKPIKATMFINLANSTTSKFYVNKLERHHYNYYFSHYISMSLFTITSRSKTLLAKHTFNSAAELYHALSNEKFRFMLIYEPINLLTSDCGYTHLCIMPFPHRNFCSFQTMKYGKRKEKRTGKLRPSA